MENKNNMKTKLEVNLEIKVVIDHSWPNENFIERL